VTLGLCSLFIRSVEVWSHRSMAHTKRWGQQWRWSTGDGGVASSACSRSIASESNVTGWGGGRAGVVGVDGVALEMAAAFVMAMMAATMRTTAALLQKLSLAPPSLCLPCAFYRQRKWRLGIGWWMLWLWSPCGRRFGRPQVIMMYRNGSMLCAMWRLWLDYLSPRSCPTRTWILQICGEHLTPYAQHWTTWRPHSGGEYRGVGSCKAPSAPRLA
jgi:hypothetical protein